MKKAKKAQEEKIASFENPEKEAKETSLPTPQKLPILVAVISALLCLAIYLLRLDRVAGLLQDDGWYILLAKALASGQGYTLINSPSAGIPPLYPPGFPALLSIVFKLAPQFPENLYLLKSVSVLAMLGVGIVSYWYFTHQRELSWGLSAGIATVTVLTPPLVFLATSTVMSECVFTLLHLLAIVVIERSIRLHGKRQIYYVVLGVGLTVVTFLTRSMALSLVLAILLYLIKERQKIAVLIFAAGLILLLGPWMLYARTHTPTPAQRLEQRGYIVIGYAEQFWHKVAGGEYLGKDTVTDLPKRAWESAVKIIGRDVGRMTFSPLYSLTGSSEEGMISFLLSLLAIVGYVAACRERITLAEIAVPFSLGITLLWPYDPIRFVLPLTPFILFYLLRGIKTCFDFLQQKLGETEAKSSWQLLGVVTCLFLVLHLYEHATYIYAKYQTNEESRPAYIRIFEENQDLLSWVKGNVAENAIIATENPPMVYLYTERKTVSQDDPRTYWDVFEKLPVRYLVRTSREPLGRPTSEETRYKIVYTTKGPLGLRVVDLGLAEHRPAWGK